MTVMRRLGVIWQSVGPYHDARLRAAREILGAHGWETVGIEVAATDCYRWKEAWQGGELEVQTLFPGMAYEQLRSREVARAVRDALDHLRPDAMAINGWFAPEAVASLRWCSDHGALRIMMSESHRRSHNPFKGWLKRVRVHECEAGLVGGSWHRDLLAELGVPRERIFLGYDVVDNAHFRLGAEEARADAGDRRERFGLPERFFLACARLIPRKNFRGLLRAFAEFSREDGGADEGERGWHLVIAGTGGEERRLRAEAVRAGVGQRVHWAGAVSYEDLPVYYGLASGFVHVAREEAWGLVINEAAAAGLPILAGTRVGAACELVRDGRNGWLVDSRSTSAISEALGKLAALSCSERAKMGRESRALVEDFGPRRFGEGLLDCVRAVSPSGDR